MEQWVKEKGKLEEWNDGIMEYWNAVEDCQEKKQSRKHETRKTRPPLFFRAFVPSCFRGSFFFYVFSCPCQCSSTP
jgi:hypothetical protein